MFAIAARQPQYGMCTETLLRVLNLTCLCQVVVLLAHVTGTLYSVIVGYSGLVLPKPRPLAPPGEGQDPYA